MKMFVLAIGNQKFIMPSYQVAVGALKTWVKEHSGQVLYQSIRPNEYVVMDYRTEDDKIYTISIFKHQEIEE